MVYDRVAHPCAAAWFKADAAGLLAPVEGYLDLLGAHQVPFERAESSDPGLMIYEDAQQVIVVPHHGP